MTHSLPEPSAQDAHDYVWHTRQGEALPLAEIGLTHLRNIESHLMTMERAFRNRLRSQAAETAETAGPSHAERSLQYIRAELVSRGYAPDQDLD